MKVFTWILMTLILLGCKDDSELSPEEIVPLVGKWHQVGYEKVTETGREWVPVNDTSVYTTVIFRPDGVPLYGNGKGMCCAPRTLVREGRPFKIVPKSPVEFDELCTRIDCMGCESVVIEINQDEMIWTSCTGSRIRYKRML
ncbi:hypothetical protein [Arundinibacter roseus]|uniref:Lipocalin-like domain-containing protein n=1 Tax=Arundinibacter roseus TaxID=2070510 RepID=A0A4R4K3W1_9BACT|nr:hypothetical protein [Arundinibacter roseus]TDB61186.1 hypothetical protein EZE20_20200 [Arundinibacter roseus]